MPTVTCPGLPADWINAWLAAVGSTVLDSRIRLHWTAGTTPVAVLSADACDPVAAMLSSWPDRRMLAELPIAEKWKGTGPLQRKVMVDAFAERARAVRGHRDSWALSSTLTDLEVDKKGEVAHAPFDPAGPGTIKWLHHRVMKVHADVKLSRERLEATLEGHADRIKDNGLGFDITRLGSLADNTDPRVDPVVEILAFFGLAILPMRGTGRDAELGHARSAGPAQRGWLRNGRDRRFVWPAWSHSLDRHGIDAFLDVWKRERINTWPWFGVHGAWQSVSYNRRATADTTRGFGSERL